MNSVGIYVSSCDNAVQIEVLEYNLRFLFGIY